MYPEYILLLKEAFAAKDLEFSFSELQGIYDDSLLPSVYNLSTRTGDTKSYLVACEKVVEAILKQQDVSDFTAANIISQVGEAAVALHGNNLEVVAHRANISHEAAELIINQKTATNLNDLIALANSYGKTLAVVSFADILTVSNRLVASDVNIVPIEKDLYEVISSEVDLPLHDHVSKISVNRLTPNLFAVEGIVHELTRDYPGLAAGSVVAGVSLELSNDFVESIKSVPLNTNVIRFGDSDYDVEAVLSRRTNDGSVSIMLFMPVVLNGERFETIPVSINNFNGFTFSANVGVRELEIEKRDTPTEG